MDIRSNLNNKQGLYDPANEHDACGVGLVVNVHGGKSHGIVESALKILENMRHRGAEGADNKTGDGAGILLQIPHEFILLQGIPVPEKGKYGTGLVFFPKDEKQHSAILSIMIEEIEKEGLTLMHLRKVPVNTDILGKDARDTEPDIKQVFITGCDDQQVLELKLYIIRKRIEKRMAASDIPNRKDFYVASLSTKSIIYKGMLESMQLRHYFPDLTNPYLTSGLALVHSRFSTNTFPTWSLAQPFRLLAHNGEINTIRGNRGWMEARESVLSSPRIPNIDEIRPIIQPDMSDSASLDNVLEFFVASGMSLPHAMAMLVPESFNEKNPISEDLKAFYEYHSILMEPWDGPAALLFSDGRYAGGMLDRNGLRPARYLITKNGMMVVASEVGVMDFEPDEIEEKGRLQPGKILLVDTEEGKIYYDGELKKQLAGAQFYRVWLANNRVELLIEQARRFMPEAVVIANEDKYEVLRDALADLPVKVYAGAEALCQIVQERPGDVVLTAMVGFAGLRPTISAIKAGKAIALANKETLVVAGELINRLANDYHADIIPVDSEHSAIFQCLAGEVSPVEKIILTASGGPFRTFSHEQLASVTKAQALKHPNWSMGAKITIDSASMMNKGFEVIEAKWLFGVEPGQIQVVVHPQSIVHSAVQFADGAVKAQLGMPDMRVPIQYAFSYPLRLQSSFERLDLFRVGTLTFEEPDTRRFRNLALAYEALHEGGNMPCIVNAANEIVNRAFLEDRIGFLQMSDVIANTMWKTSFVKKPTYEDYLQTDAEARRIAEEYVGAC